MRLNACKQLTGDLELGVYISLFNLLGFSAALELINFILFLTLMMQPKKVISFEDPKHRANQWKKAIEAIQNR